MLKRSIYFSSEKEDNNKDAKNESINNYKSLFLEYEKNIPTLSDALRQMFKSKIKNDQEVKELIRGIIIKCESEINSRFDDIKRKYNNITKEDAYIICSYTCEIDEIGKRQYSPYRILNSNLVADNREKGLKNISKYFFLLLKSLRKLPKYYPKYKKLYRCITRQVSLSKDPFNEKLVPYEIDNLKVLWAFTSTSINPRIAYEFLKDEGYEFRSGTVFTYQGDNLWGYNIHLFSYFYPNEEEVLIEPETLIYVDNVLPPQNEIINITCTIIETPLVLKNIITYNKELEKDTPKINVKPSNYFNYRPLLPKEERNRLQNKLKNNKPLKLERKILKVEDNEINEIKEHEENKKGNFDFKNGGKIGDNKKIEDSNLNKANKLSFSYDNVANRLTIEKLEEKNMANKDINKKMIGQNCYYKERGRNKMPEFEKKVELRKSYDKPFYKSFKKIFFDNKYNNNAERNKKKIMPNCNLSYEENDIEKLIHINVKAINNLGYKVNKEEEIVQKVIEKSKFEK